MDGLDVRRAGTLGRLDPYGRVRVDAPALVFKGSALYCPREDGKAEAFRVLAVRFGIARERVVAVGDADNDLEMLRGAGLGVAMGNGTESAKQAAKRMIGDNGSDALAELIEELFPE